MNGNDIRAKLDEITARVVAVRATLDIIHNTVTENPASDALYGLLFGLDGIAAEIEALGREVKV